MTSVTAFPAESDIQLRLMMAEDITRVVGLHAQLDHSSWSESQWQQAREQYPCAWVLEDRQVSIIAGYMIFQAIVPQTELLNIGIAAGYQSRGLAYKFLLAGMQLLPKDSESIFLEVRRSNIPAIGLYEKAGFVQVGERRDYYAVAGGSRENALIYKYELCPDVRA